MTELAPVSKCWFLECTSIERDLNMCVAHSQCNKVRWSNKCSAEEWQEWEIRTMKDSQIRRESRKNYSCIIITWFFDGELAACHRDVLYLHSTVVPPKWKRQNKQWTGYAWVLHAFLDVMITSHCNCVRWYLRPRSHMHHPNSRVLHLHIAHANNPVDQFSCQRQKGRAFECHWFLYLSK